MDKRKIAKRVTAIVAAYGAGTIVKTTIANQVQTDNLLIKIPVVVAAHVMAGMAGAIVGVETERRMDEFFASYDSIKQKVQEERAKTA